MDLVEHAERILDIVVERIDLHKSGTLIESG